MLHGNQNPVTIADFKAAIDAAVAKKGAVSLCFHSGGWMRPDQMAAIVDHSDRTHGKKVKFLNMREMHGRMVEHMLIGHPLRDAEGGDNGVRVLDIDADGYMDVVIGNAKAKLSRVWDPKNGNWKEVPFPLAIDTGVRFGVVDESGQAVAVTSKKAWQFDGNRWVEDKRLETGMKDDFRLRDIDGDGICELITNSAVSRLGNDGWEKLSFALPKGTAITTGSGGDAGLRFADIDDDGHDDVIFSNAERYGTWMFESMETGWSRVGISGKRGEENALPPIVRANGSNNGAWIKRGHLYWQNEDTGAQLPYHIDQRSFGDLMGKEIEKPRTPQASLRAMKPRPGFTVELLAAEPLVMDPVDVAWGPDGRMWVCEMADYPIGIDNRGKHGGRVAFLDDTDGDGNYDKRTLFADQIGYANTVLPWRDGVLVVAAPNIWFMRDTDGDGHADDRQVLYEGFGEGNQQHRGNGLAWGLDGWLYVANGDSGGRVRSTKTGKSLDLRGFDLRIRPDTGELEPATGMTQHGRNRDDWGNWVAGNNSGAWQIAMEDHDIRRNPHLTMPDARNRILGVIDLYPASRVLSHWSGYKPPPPGAPGKLTSACGFTFYRDAFFDGHVAPSIYFSCPVHNCVHREVIRWDGVLMHTSRASDEATSEFLRSADSWFRPTAIRTGPDGAMVVADMYRLVIEHPKWIGKLQLLMMIADGRLRAGEKQGRIYRISPIGAELPKPANLAAMPPPDLARAFDSTNGWQRDTAHMMLTWLAKADRRKAIAPLRIVLRQSEIAAARTQALCALADLGALEASDMIVGLDDDHPGVRRNALRAGAPLLEKHAELGGRVIVLLDDEDAKVRMQAAYALGWWPGKRAGAALGRFVVKHADRPYLRAAALTSARKFPHEVLFAVFAAERTPATASLVDALIGMLGSDDARESVPDVLARLSSGGSYHGWRFSAAARLLDAVDDPALPPQMAKMFVAARAAVVDEDLDLATRLAAVSLIARTLEDTDRLASLLKITTPVELQVAAVNALATRDDADIAKQLLAGWSEHGPAVRTAILDALLARPTLTKVLLHTLAGNPDLAASLDVPRRQFLLEHDNDSIRKQAAELLGGPTRPDRAAVIKSYAAALSKPGDRDIGKAVFATVCVACHRLDGVGNAIAPDLAALTDRSSEAYLVGILDPNQAIQENWMQFTAMLVDGRTLVGSLVGETSSGLTLVGIDGSRTKVPRRELASLNSTGRSLMPEGLEATINVNQMADLLAYLRVAGDPRKTFPNNTPKLIDQADDGTLTLPASAAEVYGPSIIFEQKYRNLGYWTNTRDRAEWTFHLSRDGEYDLWINWALDGGSVGGTIKLTIGDQSLESPVPGSGSWDAYLWGRVGSLRLPAGRHRLIATKESSTGAPLIDLRHLRLAPKDSDAPSGGIDWPSAATP